MMLHRTLPLLALGWTVGGLAMAGLVAHAGTPDARRAAAGGIIAVILANIVAFFLMRMIGKNLDA